MKGTKIQKFIVILLMLLIVALPLFADGGDSGSGMDKYFVGIAKAAQILAILFASICCVYCGVKIFMSGLSSENTRYIIALVVGIIVISLALTLPTWIQNMG